MLRADPELRAPTIFRPNMVHLLKATIQLHSSRQGVHVPLHAWTDLHNTCSTQILLLFVASCSVSSFMILYKKKGLRESNAANQKIVTGFCQFDFGNFWKSNILPELHFTNYIHKINFFPLNFISRNSSISFHLLNKILGIVHLNIFFIKNYDTIWSQTEKHKVSSWYMLNLTRTKDW